MNKQLADYARFCIVTGLLQLPDDHRVRFNRMYAPDDLTLDPVVVVNRIPDTRLNWAMDQVNNSLKALRALEGRNKC